MKNFFVLLGSLSLFFVFDNSCMLRLSLQKKRIGLPKRIFSNKKIYYEHPDYLCAQINALEETIKSYEQVMHQQYLIINDLKNKLQSLPNNPRPISQKNYSTVPYLANSYIPEHNMHYGNKDHE